jgi:5-methylcytosine-specific restriction endonuclease McrA
MAVSKHRAGGRWSEARYFSFIRSALRKASMRWPVKQDVLNENRRAKQFEGRHKFEYQCEACEEWKVGKEVAVDHINPAGSLKTYADLPGFVERLFCEADNLQLLCVDCHQAKTNKEREDAK